MTKNKQKAGSRFSWAKTVETIKSIKFTGNSKKFLAFTVVVVAAGFLSYGSLNMFKGNLYLQPNINPGSIGTISNEDLSVVYTVDATYNSSAKKFYIQLSLGTDNIKSVSYTIEKPNRTTTSELILRPLYIADTYKFPTTIDVSDSASYPTGAYEIKARISKTDGSSVSAVDDTVSIPFVFTGVINPPAVVVNPPIEPIRIIPGNQITIVPPAISPEIESPAEGATAVSLTPTISWSITPTTTPNQLDRFSLYIATDSDFDNLIYEKENITKSTRSVSVPTGELSYNTNYYAKLVARNVNNTDVIRLIFDTTNFRTLASGTTPPPVDPGTGDVLVNFARSSSDIEEDDDDTRIQVNLSRALPYSVDVYYSLSLETEADFGDDFRVPSSKKVAFAAGETSSYIDVEIYDDRNPEFDEEIVLKLSSFGFSSYSANLIVGDRNEHELTIEDNDGGLSRGGSSSSKISCEKYFIDIDRYHPLCNEVAELRDLGIFMGQETARGRLANIDAKLMRSEYFKIAARLTGNNRAFIDRDYLSQFKDLSKATMNDPGNAWWLEAITSLRGIVRGYGDGTLQPTRITTEAEISKVALEAIFRDFTNRDNLDPWYKDSLNFMADFGFYADPIRKADRGDAVEIIYIILKAVDDIDYYNNLWR